VAVAVAVAVVDGVAVGVTGEPVTVTVPRMVPAWTWQTNSYVPGWVNLNEVPPCGAGPWSGGGAMTWPQAGSAGLAVPTTLCAWPPPVAGVHVHVIVSPVCIASVGLSQLLVRPVTVWSAAVSDAAATDTPTTTQPTVARAVATRGMPPRL
jgi:hypothetical protein